MLFYYVGFKSLATTSMCSYSICLSKKGNQRFHRDLIYFTMFLTSASKSISICYLLLINLLNFYSEVITSAEFHPFHCNLLAYSSSRGFIYLVDMRRSALCDHSAILWVSAHFCFISMVHVSWVLILHFSSHYLLFLNALEDALILVIWGLILQITRWRIPWV